MLADCQYNVAFQADTRDEFKKAIQMAGESYQKIPAGARCKGRAAFCQYWESDNAEERRRIMAEQCVPSGRQALIELKGAGRNIAARAYVELLEYLCEACAIASDKRTLDASIKELKLVGKNAMSQLRKTEERQVLEAIVNAYAIALFGPFPIALDPLETKRVSRELTPFGKQLTRATSRSNAQERCLVHETAGIIAVGIESDFAKALILFQKALTEARLTGNKYQIGRQLVWILYSSAWVYETTDNKEKRNEILRRCSRIGPEAIESLKVPLATPFLMMSYYWFVGYLKEIGKTEPLMRRKLDTLDKSLALGEEGLSYQRFSPLSAIAQSIAEAAEYKSDVVPDENERRNLLSHSIVAMKDYIKQLETLSSKDSWNLGCQYGQLGRLELKSSEQVRDPGEKLSLVTRSSMEFLRSIKLLKGSPMLKGHENTPAEYSEDLGKARHMIYEHTCNKDDCLATIRAYAGAVALYRQLNMQTYTAPLTWEAAKLYDSISEYKESARAYMSASRDYKTASKYQKSLKAWLADLSFLMKAYSKVEESKLLLDNGDKTTASRKLEEASSILAKSDAFKSLVIRRDSLSQVARAIATVRLEPLAELKKYRAQSVGTSGSG
jgi:tetratricopeptide (TPR) repeat protein